jgi:hypothetical protein
MFVKSKASPRKRKDSRMMLMMVLFLILKMLSLIDKRQHGKEMADAAG